MAFYHLVYGLEVAIPWSTFIDAYLSRNENENEYKNHVAYFRY